MSSLFPLVSIARWHGASEAYTVRVRRSDGSVFRLCASTLSSAYAYVADYHPGAVVVRYAEARS